MPPPLDIRAHFNDPTLSDVTIKVGALSFNCHKIVLLSSESDYFKTLLNPHSKFVESRQAVIELKEDDPMAVEVMLRYLYGHDYQRSTDMCNQAATGWTMTMAMELDLKVFVTARKYLLHTLQEEASGALDKKLDFLKEDSMLVPVEMKFALTKLLAAYRDDYGQILLYKTKVFITACLPDLMALSSFRQWLELDGRFALPLLLAALQVWRDG